MLKTCLQTGKRHSFGLDILCLYLLHCPRDLNVAPSPKIRTFPTLGFETLFQESMKKRTPIVFACALSYLSYVSAEINNCHWWVSVYIYEFFLCVSVRSYWSLQMLMKHNEMVSHKPETTFIPVCVFVYD